MPRVKQEDQVSKEQMEQFAFWMRQARNSQGYTQDEIAHRLGISSSYYNSLENCRRISTKRMLFDIAVLFNDTKIIADVLGEDVLNQFLEGAEGIRKGPSSVDKIMALNHLPVTEDGGYIMEVPISPVLSWWGFFPGQVAHIRLVSNVNTLLDGQFVYITNEDGEEGLFMFANFSDPKKPMFETPESVLVQYFALGRNWAELDEWELDQKQINYWLPLVNANFRVHEVMNIVTPVQSSMKPFLNPYQPKLSMDSKKQLIKQAIFTHRLERAANVHGENQLEETSELEDSGSSSSPASLV